MHAAIFFALPALLLITYFVINEFVRYSRRIKGIPGPTGLPILGNLHQIRVNAPEKYRQWSKQYGPVFQIMLGNEPVVVVNSAKAAHETFLSQGNAMSSRPMFYTFHKVLSSTAGFTIGTSPASESLKRRRKAAASALNRPSVQSYVPFLHLETADFIRDLWERGGKGAQAIDCMPMIQRLSLNLSLTLNWGDRIGSLDDHLFDEITECEEYISRFRSTTGNLQDYIPILRYSPVNKNSAKAVEMRARRDVYLRKLNTDLQNRIDNGTDRPCIQGNVLKDPEAKLSEEELISISLTMLSGGLDTITTTLAWAVALLSQRPDIQEKGYQEIKKAYGDDISEIWTNPGEEARVPYITAFTREILRFFTVLRLALPRATQRDVKYEGMVIPEGSTVFLNAWACNMDPDVFENPHSFAPERFLANPDLPIFTYGVGTRMCAGYVLGNRELYIVFLRLISGFQILPDQMGEKLDYDPVRGVYDPTSLVSYPKRFGSRFVARDDKKLGAWLAKATIDDQHTHLVH